jgi:predicted RNA-binding protein YlxR (DUF448 family)/ribosomal protein L7Ae-like RNA K-turn-binding protein
VSVLAALPDAPEAEPQAGEDATTRRCLVTGELKAKDGLIRFVVGPAEPGQPAPIVPDIDARLPGRGLWITARRDIVSAAISRKAFAKAAGAPVTVSTDLPEIVAGLLVRRCLDLIGLARRAGQAVAGYEKVRAALGGPVGLLMVASDSGEDIRRRVLGPASGVAIAATLDAAELGSAFGRDRVAVVALRSGRLAAQIEREAGRVGGFRGEQSGSRVMTADRR